MIANSNEAIPKIDILVLPSAAEGFGLVLIEAMAAGIPVVATNVAGIRDVVRDGMTGLLVQPFAPAELWRAIDRLLNDLSLRNRLVAQARVDVVRRFSWDVVLPQYARQVLAAKARSLSPHKPTVTLRAFTCKEVTNDRSDFQSL